MTSRQAQHGFTIVEIVVSTAIFASTLTLMLVLFTYTLKINRKIEALRQVSQATRNFTEFLAREVRNGSIDYTGTVDSANCPPSYNLAANNTYLAIANRGGDRECFYLVNNSGVGSLMVTKRPISGAAPVTEQVSPANVNIDPTTFHFYVRPITDPKVKVGGSYPGIQPFVTMVMALTVRLNPIDKVTIPYQTTISTDVYDIPHR